MQQLDLFGETDFPPVRYWPGFLSRAQADDLLKQSLNLRWQQNQITMFGKPQVLPRLEAMFGDSDEYFYTYSGSVELRAKTWPPFLLELRDIVETITGHRYQVVIGNQYRDCRDSIGYHADDERSLGVSPAIASISLGATRTFRIKGKCKGSRSHPYQLSHGDLLLMEPGCQEFWQHTVPKSNQPCGVRINWTFRPYQF
jgi:alkylated DNA repair dioxygenase AlkB